MSIGFFTGFYKSFPAFIFNLTKRQVVCFGHTHDQYCGQWGDVFLFNPGAVLSDCYGSIHIHDHSNGITFRHWYWNDGDATLHDEYHFQGSKTAN